MPYILGITVSMAIIGFLSFKSLTTINSAYNVSV